MNKYVKFILFIVTVNLFSSCDKNRVFEENKQISDQIWNLDEKLSFEVNVEDTLTSHNFYMNVRNADGYPYTNIFLFITTQFPNGKMAHDTLECILADASGKWLGDGLGDIWDNQIPFKKGVRFPLKGKYIFTLQHGMRTENLPLILDAGIRIEKSGN